MFENYSAKTRHDFHERVQVMFLCRILGSSNQEGEGRSYTTRFMAICMYGIGALAQQMMVLH